MSQTQTQIQMQIIEQAFEQTEGLDLTDTKLVRAVEETIGDLDCGKITVMQKTENGFIHNEWIKKAILLYFRMKVMRPIDAGELSFFDKVPVKKWTGSEGVRVVPQGLVRYGAFVNRGAIIMPSFVNIGAHVGSGTMVDTWATVGSCAYIGANVHLSGGVGIGGVLEPVQAKPVVVEDNAFIGSRCIVVEGVHIEEGAVLGAGVTITASTKILDVTGSSEVVYVGRVPQNSVVIPGSFSKEFKAGAYQVPCALIIGKRKESTNLKTSLTQALREYNVAV